MAYMAKKLVRGMCRSGRLARTPLGYVLLDSNGLSGFLQAALIGMPQFSAPMCCRACSEGCMIRRRRWPLTDARKLAVARALRADWRGECSIRPSPFGYAKIIKLFNTGHSNLSERVMTAIAHCRGGAICRAVHDCHYRLEYPQYQREGHCSRNLNARCSVCADCDLLIYNSADTQQRTWSG